MLLQFSNKIRLQSLKNACCAWVLLLTLCVIGFRVSAQEPRHSEALISAASINAFRCYDLGTFRFCLSAHGNIVSFRAPSSSPENIGIAPVREGYVVCATWPNGLDSHDAEDNESGFTISEPPQEPNGMGRLPLIITRVTASNLKLKQTFTANAADREIIVKMEIQNQDVVDKYVRFDRYFDGDIGGTSGGDSYSRSVDSVWGQEGLHALILTDANSPVIPHTTSVQNAAVFVPTNCGQTTAPTPTGPGDFVGRMNYNLKLIYGRVTAPPDGMTKTFTVKYRKL